VVQENHSCGYRNGFQMESAPQCLEYSASLTCAIASRGTDCGLQSFCRFSDRVGQFILSLCVFELGLQQERLGLQLLRGSGVGLRA
jgi:hypothetical protein